MLRALLLLIALLVLIGWSARLARGAWRERGSPAFALFRLFVAYLVASLSVLMIAAMLDWAPLLEVARTLAWPFVRVGEAYGGALRETLPQALVPMAAIVSSLIAAVLLLLIDRRLRPSGTSA